MIDVGTQIGFCQGSRILTSDLLAWEERCQPSVRPVSMVSSGYGINQALKKGALFHLQTFGLIGVPGDEVVTCAARSYKGILAKFVDTDTTN